MSHVKQTFIFPTNHSMNKLSGIDGRKSLIDRTKGLHGILSKFKRCPKHDIVTNGFKNCVV
jgi:hypothetical protein